MQCTLLHRIRIQIILIESSKLYPLRRCATAPLRPAPLRHCATAPLRHFCAITTPTQHYCATAQLGHFATVPLLRHCATAPLRHCAISIPLHCVNGATVPLLVTPPQRHCATALFRHRSTASLRHCATAQWRHRAITFHSAIAPLRHCAISTPLDCVTAPQIYPTLLLHFGE